MMINAEGQGFETFPPSRQTDINAPSTHQTYALHRANRFLWRNRQEVRGEDAQRYRLNAHRVLLTRARQGMVIVVPEGCVSDPTRHPSFYDPTWQFLLSIGLPQFN